MAEKPEQEPRKPDLRVLDRELENTPVAAEPAPDAERDRSTAPVLADRAHGEIYPRCPVTALGVYGKVFYYLDLLGQLQDEKKHDRDRIRAIFGGRGDLLTEWFPRVGKGGAVLGWDQEASASQMQRACSEKGVWNALERVRGLGAWPDDDGGLIWHCGNAILYKGAWRNPGEIDGFVYPSKIVIPRPLEEEVGIGEGSPGQDFLETAETWSWMRPAIDPVLFLGWNMAAMAGGALDWRPMIWITGDKGTGKSTLQKLISYLMGGTGAILQSTDTTEAALRQINLENSTPIALDEMEAEADGRRVQGVIKLARQAASGGVILRGGQDHKGAEFKARSAFMFSSINVPSLLDQDISRMALLELLPLATGVTPPSIEPKRWGKIGRGLRTRIVNGWSRLEETLELYRQALSAAGHPARGCDQFGTLLAMADLALYDAKPSPDRCKMWAERLSADIIQEQTDEAADWQRCLNHLFGQPLDPYRNGARLSVGRWILCAANIEEDHEPGPANKALASVGLRVHGRKDAAQLVVANAHSGLAELFVGTHWYAPAGQKGVWAQAMKRVPGSQSAGPTRFDLVSSRGRRFPLRAIPALLEENEASPEATPHSDPPEQFV